jgi:hypothetical protein
MHIKQTHKSDTQLNLLKENVSQTHGLIEIDNNETPTHGIVHAGFRGMRPFVACKKNWSKLISFRFLIPHDTIPSNVEGPSLMHQPQTQQQRTRPHRAIYITGIPIGSCVEVALEAVEEVLNADAAF